MEPQLKPSFNEYNKKSLPSALDVTKSQSVTSNRHNLRSSSSSSSSSPSILSSSKIELTRCILRAIAIALTFTATIVMSTGKDTTRVSIADPTSMKTTNFVETVRPRYSSALVYFIVTNVLMFVYSASSLAATFLIKDISKNLELALTISDILFLILLFSTNGAAITTTIMIEHGNVHLGWIKICDAVSCFCSHVLAAVVLSISASVAHLGILLLQIIVLHIKY